MGKYATAYTAMQQFVNRIIYIYMEICCIIYTEIHMRHEVEPLGLFIDETELTERGISSADNEKLITMVEYVSKNIKKYTEEKYIYILWLLKNKCTEKGLTAGTIEMYHTIGMQYFYRNKMKIALEMLQIAIDLAKENDMKELLVTCSSELGLVYFYKHEHKSAEIEYKRVEKLLPDIPEPDKHILFLHYYRYGILHRISHKHERAQEALEKALSYAEEKVYVGLTLMNIGINYEVQSNFDKALEYYDKALDTFDKNDYFSKSLVYNNLAELYKAAGDYNKALKHINKAFEYLNNKDEARLFTYFTTYTEISVLMGEPEKALDKFMEMFFHIQDYAVYKSYITENIDSLAAAGAKDRKMMEKLEAVVVKLIELTSSENPEYKQELERCLGNIRKNI